MPKGVNALELIFAMFILIVVAFVVIRLFTGVVSPSTLPNIQDFKETYNYQQEKQKCENLCNRFIESNCQDYSAAASYCLQKVSLSIDGNSVTGERGHYGMVANLPYCEDGLYCFHINDCTCGSVVLDAKNCLIYLQSYYMEKAGFSESATKQLICSDTGIKPGSCCPEPTTCNPKQWSVKPKGFNATTYPDIDATHWWVNAGYGAYCTGVGPSGGGGGAVSLSNCQLDKSTDPWSFKCDTNCLAADTIGVTDSNKLSSGEPNPTIAGGKVISQPTQPRKLNDLKCPDTWTVTLSCTNPDSLKQSILVCS
jgi:hypothetical protein